MLLENTRLKLYNFIVVRKLKGIDSYVYVIRSCILLNFTFCLHESI